MYDFVYCVCPLDTCLVTYKGYLYTGDKDVTESGITCQTWTTTDPQEHDLMENFRYPDQTIEDASNHCRNPDSDARIWCYQIEGDRYDWCDIPMCTGEKNKIV